MMTVDTKHRKKMVLFSCRVRVGPIFLPSRKAQLERYNERAFDGEATKLGSCVRFPTSINQNSTPNFVILIYNS